jgi:hypothetical protein
MFAKHWIQERQCFGSSGQAVDALRDHVNREGVARNDESLDRSPVEQSESILSTIGFRVYAQA